MFSEKCLSKETIYAGRVFTVRKDGVELSDGKVAMRELIVHNGGACVLATAPDGRVPLVRQYRYGAGEELLELPAGKLEEGEDPLECARRELAEECGFAAARWTALGHICPTPAYCSERIYLFRAEELSPVPQNLDEGEFLAVEYYSREELRRMCADGRISDAKTLAAVLRS